jgi:hypothetical protein
MIRRECLNDGVACHWVFEFEQRLTG